MEVWAQSETVDPEVKAFVTSLVNALGGRSTYDDSYCMSPKKRLKENRTNNTQRLATMRLRSSRICYDGYEPTTTRSSDSMCDEHWPKPT